MQKEFRAKNGYLRFAVFPREKGWILNKTAACCAHEQILFFSEAGIDYLILLTDTSEKVSDTNDSILYVPKMSIGYLHVVYVCSMYLVDISPPQSGHTVEPRMSY